MVRQLRVTADDFGLTSGVSDGIIDAHQKGIVTHTSILVGGIDYARAVKNVKEINTLGVGAHLALTDVVPQLPSLSAKSLIIQGGKFPSLKVLLKRAFQNRLQFSEVQNEWRAQIERVIADGIVPTHLDSHHHVHLLPGCFEIAKQLAREFSIPWVRFPNEGLSFSRYSIMQLGKIVAFRILSKWNGIEGFNTSFRGLALQGRENFQEALMKTIQKLPQGVTELMVHPGWEDSRLKEIDSYVSQRELELRVLCDPLVMELLEKEQIELARYNQSDTLLVLET